MIWIFGLSEPFSKHTVYIVTHAEQLVANSTTDISDPGLSMLDLEKVTTLPSPPSTPLVA